VKVLIIDNFDSFTYNLVQLVKESETCSFDVIRADQLHLDTPAHFDGIIISPGPGVPSDIPILKKIILHYQKEKSILGICLGHQAITEAYGGCIKNMPKVFHGIKQKIFVIESSDYLFMNVPDVFYGGLYHSWESDAANFPEVLKVTAVSENQVIMALLHREYDIRAVQFHPESYMTEYGKRIIDNWTDHLSRKKKETI